MNLCEVAIRKMGKIIVPRSYNKANVSPVQTKYLSAHEV